MYTHIVATDGEYLPNSQCAGTSYIAHTSKSETKILAHMSNLYTFPPFNTQAAHMDIYGALNAGHAPKSSPRQHWNQHSEAISCLSPLPNPQRALCTRAPGAAHAWCAPSAPCPPQTSSTP